MLKIKRLTLVMVAFCALTNAAVAGDLRYSTVTGANDVPLQVVQAGSPTAPGILFLHGWSLSSGSWQQQLESSLADDFHLVAMDLRGHGNSGKPWDRDNYQPSNVWADDIAAVMAATGLERPLVVAWSMGGHVTMDFVRHYSAAKLAGIVFVGSNGGMQPFPPFDESTAAEFARLTPLSMSANAADRLEAARAFVKGMTQTPLAPAVFDREVATVLSLPPYVRSATMGRDLDNADLIASLNLPVLFLMGYAERTTTPEGISKLVEQLPQAEMFVYEATGHMPFIERFEQFNIAVREFAASVLAED
ncbi:MAG: alpha/beta hydrolase [Gammaproteobacteria bacterium]|nr:alpha/beta hydrolase [Gammaproteobacteria bacterium]NND53862.1 alpha/beta hydrolase [Gammaproteobacteria bacterium]